MTTTENQIELDLIAKLGDLKYTARPDIRDRVTLEANFRDKFQQLNRVKLTDEEFARLLEEIVTPDVFTAAQTLRSRNSFIREDGTPLNYTLVNIDDWCKNDFEVVNQLRINTDSRTNRVLFRGGAEERIRHKLLEDGHIDTVIGLPANLFYSTGIPVCILVLKKCKKPDDVLFINAAEHFEKGKRQNQLTEEYIRKIIDTYQQRPSEVPRYARRVGMEEIEKNDFNLNISRYVSTAVAEDEVDLEKVHQQLVDIEKEIVKAKDKHNDFLKELKLPLLP